jgi:MFS family permease
MLKLLGIGVLLQLLQQLCGMNAYMYDGPKIFEKLFESGHAGRLFTAIAGMVNILSTFPAIFLVDKLGRTALLKYSAAGMAVCSMVLAIVGEVCFPAHHSGCDRSEHAHGCMQIDDPPVCGDWAKWAATASICLFIFNFGYGWGPVVWTYCAEMFPTKYRTKAVGATTDANWVGNMGIAFLPPILLHYIGFNTFWVFFGVNVIGYALGSCLPETKDKSLEEIQSMFKRFFHPPGKNEDAMSLSDDSDCGSSTPNLDDKGGIVNIFDLAAITHLPAILDGLRRGRMPPRPFPIMMGLEEADLRRPWLEHPHRVGTRT